MNSMSIRIKCDGKCRKATELPKTIEELRSKISGLFGSLAAKMDINYKDCDGELVSIIDTEDLKNCLAEAEAYKMTCVTLLLKDGNTASRSMSSKKRSSESSQSKTSSESEDSHGFETVGDVKATKVQAQEEAELLKKKLIEEHQRALAQLEEETKSKISEIETKKERRVKGHPEGQHKGMGHMLMHKVKALVRFCNSENIDNPLVTVKGFFKSLKEDFPALECNPELLNLILKDSEASILYALKSSAAKVISANPQIAKKSEANKEKFGEMKKELCKGEGKFERAEGAQREHRKAEKFAEKEQRKREKEAHKLEKDAEKAERKAKKLEMKQAKDSQKDHVDDQEKQIRAKVKALKEQFPNAHKPQLRAIVTQNPTLSPQDLAPMIKASRIAKSSYK